MKSRLEKYTVKATLVMVSVMAAAITILADTAMNAVTNILRRDIRKGDLFFESKYIKKRSKASDIIPAVMNKSLIELPL